MRRNAARATSRVPTSDSAYRALAVAWDAPVSAPSASILSQTLGGGRHIVDVLATKDDRQFLISLKWQQVGGTAEQKVPFEIMRLVHARQAGAYTAAYLVLGGEGWSLREFLYQWRA